ncbi:MAG: NAD(P)/FAD-dependent oxidoreductase [Muribaculum sp.]|nr:NAD(P)/FAD-dependent oxidoreductase [Muribaculum sp.]
MSNQKVIIIGAGLGGLVCSAILAKEGFDVTVVEKNQRVGGCLQSYSRANAIFDTGMHIFGGMYNGGNIRRIFDYLGIFEMLDIQNLDAINDIEVFVGKDKTRHTFCLNRGQFVESLSKEFPNEKQNLENYLNKVDDVMEQMDLFHLRKDKGFNAVVNEDFNLPSNRFISKYINDNQLAAMLGVLNVLYAGEADITPAFLHSSISSIFFNGACRIAGGYETLANALTSVITKYGGKIVVNSKVIKINTDNKKIVSVLTENGNIIKGNTFILSIPPNTLESLLDNPSLLSNSYRHFLSEKEDSISSFIVNIRLKKDKIEYTNSVGFFLEDYDKTWEAESDADIKRFMYMTPPITNQGKFAETLNVVVPLRWSVVKQWEKSEKGSREKDYYLFKDKLVKSIIEKLSNIYPNLRDAIEYIDSASPLTIRDYTGVRHGAMCGLRKDCNDTIPFIPLRTKIPNLLLTGQSINMHGFCGVTLTAVQTCEAILGKDYLINKL